MRTPSENSSSGTDTSPSIFSPSASASGKAQPDRLTSSPAAVASITG